MPREVACRLEGGGVGNWTWNEFSAGEENEFSAGEENELCGKNELISPPYKVIELVGAQGGSMPLGRRWGWKLDLE